MVAPPVVLRGDAPHIPCFDSKGRQLLSDWDLTPTKWVGALKPFSQVVTEMPALLVATPDDGDGLVVGYNELGYRNPLSPSGVRVRDHQTHRPA
jgi:hypothetical protein